jgi:hypothetical protein
MLKNSCALALAILSLGLAGCEADRVDVEDGVLTRLTTEFDGATATAEIYGDGNIVAELVAPETGSALGLLSYDAAAGEIVLDLGREPIGETLEPGVEPTQAEMNRLLYEVWRAEQRSGETLPAACVKYWNAPIPWGCQLCINWCKGYGLRATGYCYSKGTSCCCVP